MNANRTHANPAATKGVAMKGTTITVDLSKTIGQESAIKANGGPLFSIRVTCPAQATPNLTDGTPQASMPGFGRVTCAGPVKGYEVLYTLESVVA